MSTLFHRFEFDSNVYEAEISYIRDAFEVVELNRRYAVANGKELFGSLHPEDIEWTRVVRYLEPFIPELIKKVTP